MNKLECNELPVLRAGGLYRAFLTTSPGFLPHIHSDLNCSQFIRKIKDNEQFILLDDKDQLQTPIVNAIMLKILTIDCIGYINFWLYGIKIEEIK